MQDIVFGVFVSTRVQHEHDILNKVFMLLRPVYYLLNCMWDYNSAGVGSLLKSNSTSNQELLNQVFLLQFKKRYCIAIFGRDGKLAWLLIPVNNF